MQTGQFQDILLSSRLKGFAMKKQISVAIAVAVMLAAFAGYYYWQHNQPKPQLVSVQPPPPPPPPEPEIRQVIETPPAVNPLPALTDSDSFMLDALADLIGNKSLMRFFHTGRIIHNIVATIDNLPRRDFSINVMPLRKVPGKFIASGADPVISPRNAARYTPYMRILAAADSKKTVELYVRLYPLFQQAYEDLGYPKKYFNDRLMVVIDELLATPDIREPVRLILPSVHYKFADPDLENRSIGQRILMRMGSKNEAIVKAWLVQIKQQLMLHLDEVTSEKPA
jgi:hypothetical protein